MILPEQRLNKWEVSISMYLGYFEEAAYDNLFISISNNEQHYTKNEDWLDDYFSEKAYFKQSGVSVASQPQLVNTPNASDTEKSQDDLVNTKLLYDAFKTLTPLQATNKYMWSYLAHVVFKDYVIGRWMENARENTIKTRFFVVGKDGLFDNAISRLWWFGYISYQPSNTNPWSLTETLLLSQQTCTDLIDEAYSRNKEIIQGMLQALKNFHEDYPRLAFTTPWRSCVQYINRQGGIVNLDYIGADKIQEMAYNYMVKINNL